MRRCPMWSTISSGCWLAIRTWEPTWRERSRRRLPRPARLGVACWSGPPPPRPWSVAWPWSFWRDQGVPMSRPRRSRSPARPPPPPPRPGSMSRRRPSRAPGPATRARWRALAPKPTRLRGPTRPSPRRPVLRPADDASPATRANRHVWTLPPRRRVGPIGPSGERRLPGGNGVGSAAIAWMARWPDRQPWRRSRPIETIPSFAVCFPVVRARVTLTIEAERERRAASRLAFVVSIAVLFGSVAFNGKAARADPATDEARNHYETGLELFYAREHAQALIEFQRAHEVKPRPATVFMMGQCEYLLGSLRQARDHYEAYLQESPSGEFVEVAKDRIESINRRPATLVINTVPDQVEVRITPVPALAPIPTASTTGSPPSAAAFGVPPPLDGSGSALAAITGQAPNNFNVPRGRWEIAVSKINYQSQHLVVDLEVAETKPLFFKLEPIPARLEIETIPSGATLYVNGNRARNPYRQDVPPGHVELFAQATDYADRTEDFVLGPGARRLLVGPHAFNLCYVQR